MSKCEHGLTTKECLVCASAKHGAAPEPAQVALSERERCARICEDEARLWEADGKGLATEARLCAARIRSSAAAQPDPTTEISDLAHELWAIAQSPAPIDDVVALMRDELHKFVAAAFCSYVRQSLSFDSEYIAGLSAGRNF